MEKKLKYDVICPCDKQKTFPIVVIADDRGKEAISSKEVYCPFCNELITVSFDALKTKPDTTVLRGGK
jgi:hypothetical protein